MSRRAKSTDADYIGVLDFTPGNVTWANLKSEDFYDPTTGNKLPANLVFIHIESDTQGNTDSAWLQLRAMTGSDKAHALKLPPNGITPSPLRGVNLGAGIGPGVQSIAMGLSDAADEIHIEVLFDNR